MNQQKKDQKFNLEQYETVKERKKRFYEKFPDGRIIAELIKGDENQAQFKATIFKDVDDQKESLPLSTGYAQEFKGQGGFANRTSWLENCEESAIGRALDNAGFSGNNKCSREEMEKVERAVEAGQAASTSNPLKVIPTKDVGAYQMRFGKYKGLALSDIDPFDLRNYADFIVRDAEEKGKEIRGQVREALEAIDEFIASRTPNGNS